MFSAISWTISRASTFGSAGVGTQHFVKPIGVQVDELTVDPLDQELGQPYTPSCNCCSFAFVAASASPDSGSPL